MAWDNDWKWGYLKGGWPEPGKPLATRRNVDKAKAAERVMLEQVEGQDGIRKRVSDDVTLRTRGGFPVFEADTKTAEATGYRWFSVLTGTKLGLIDPYALTVQQQTLKQDVTYRVAPISSSAGLTSKFGWNDVWLFDNESSTLYINYRQHERLADPIPRPSGDNDLAGRVPVLLLDDFPPVGAAALSPYDGVSKAAAVKPACAVGRLSVAVMQTDDSVPPVVLGGAVARAELRALLSGPRIVGNKAYLGQLTYLGSMWDDPLGGWSALEADVTLSAVALDVDEQTKAVDLASVVFGSGSSSSGTSTTNDNANDIILGLIGIGERGVIMTEALLGGGRATTVFPWRMPWRGTVAINRNKSFTRTTYTGTLSDSGYLHGLSYTVSAENTLYRDVGTELVRIPSQTIYSGAPTTGQWMDFGIWHSVEDDGSVLFHAESNAAHDTSHQDPPAPVANRGTPNITTSTSNSSVSGNIAPYVEVTQAGASEITVDGVTIMTCEFSRRTESGSKETVGPNNSLYASMLANPYGSITPSSFTVGGAVGRDGNWVADWEEYPALYAEVINATLDAEIGDLWYWKADYPNEFIDLQSRFSTSITTRVLDDRLLLWETRDYVLYDKEEGYFIYVRSIFSATKSYGQSPTANLAVALVCETPSGTAETRMFDETVPLGDLLAYNPEFRIGGTIDCIPTHALRLFFSPPYWSQGMFPGLAHTTAAERAAGVEHAELIDFTIDLAYDDFNGVGLTAPTSRLTFAPRNLIEMLYAFVYTADQYGHSDDRYPIANTSAYNLLGERLFGRSWRIQLRNGVETNWPAPLGAPYGTTEAKRLGRT